MPHKRAKRSVRERQRSQMGTDLAPAKHIASLSTERIPKSLSRVLGAAQIRENWRERKRKLEEEGVGADRKRKERKLTGLSVEESDRNPLAIQPGEALAHFNKRVETHMAPLVKSAVQTSAAVSRRVRHADGLRAKRGDTKEKRETQNDDKKTKPSDSKDGHSLDHMKNHADPSRKAFLTPSSVPRRLNDIVLAPPELTKFPRRGGNAHVLKEGTSMGSVVSMAQKTILEAERQKAIMQYREMKEKKNAPSIS